MTMRDKIRASMKAKQMERFSFLVLSDAMYDDLADGVLDALTEPTPEMLHAGLVAYQGDKSIEAIFPAIIRAAKNDKPS